MTRASKGDVTAVVAAGGYARRLGTHCPKSFICVGGETLLSHCVRSLLRAAVNRVVLFVDRTGWDQAAADLFAGEPRVHVVRDCSPLSTFALVREGARLSNSRVLFTYGHAPRRTHHLTRLLSLNHLVVASTTPSTSRRSPLVTVGGGYLEPPLLIDAELLSASVANDWQQFFRQQAAVVRTVNLDGPPEFNYASEFRTYSRYVQRIAQLEAGQHCRPPQCTALQRRRWLPVT
jgi:CTP:molybdopterin cytidylyltransferase MocA